MATSPIAEKRTTSKRFIFISFRNVVQQLANSRGKIFLLFQKNVQFLFTLLMVFQAGVGPVHFLLHMVDFQSQNGKTVNCPGRTFRIDEGIRQNGYCFEFIQKIAVNQLH